MLSAKNLGSFLVPVGLLVAPDAHALGASVNPGLIISGVTGDSPAFGLGTEFSMMLFPRERTIVEQTGFGAFFQAQSYDFDHGRYAAGVQIGSLLGGELGWAYREQSDALSSSHGLHLALFASLGVPVLSLRTTIPIQSRNDPTRSDPGVELAFCLSLKIPMLIGVEATGNMSSGRPLRDGECLLLPELVVRRRAPRASLRLGARAQRWARDAQAEQASVPAFLRLADELSSHGAIELAARARVAAWEEARHARACLAVARGESGLGFELGPVPLPPARQPDLSTLAAESVIEGYVGEGAAAASARSSLLSERAPLARRALELIAREEQGHAELARDVLRFCVARGGRSVRSAARDAADSCRVRLPL
jgi:hypothetical protein